MLSHTAIREATFEELLGEDLTNKTVEFRVLRLTGEAVLSTDKAIGVSTDCPTPGDYRIVFTPEYEECKAGTCEHPSTGDSSECFSNDLQGYYFTPTAKLTIKETVKLKEKETQQMNNEETQKLHERVAVLTRETNRLLPQLFRKMIGSGGVSIDTDSMSLADPRDRHHLEWLARIAAGFVLEEQATWEPQVQELIQKVAKHQERERDLDNLLGKLRAASASETVTVEELQALIGEYRDPLEDHYYQIRKSRETMQSLMDMMSTPAKSAEAQEG